MRKFLLTFAAFVVAMTMSAQNSYEEAWAASFEPVTSSSELSGVHTAVSADGSVYVSSTYDQAFVFGNSEVADPEGLTSAGIVKYAADGSESWAVTMFGDAVVTAMTADSDGTLYATGRFIDLVEYTGTNGETSTIFSDYKYSAFVAKISADGTFEAVEVITPETDSYIGSLMGDPWGDGFEMPLYSAWDPIYVTPNKIQIDGDKIYVSASYYGDVPSIGWEGSYINAWGSYMDNKSMGVFSMDKASLENAANVAYVQVTGEVVDYDYASYPDALSFAADNGTVYVGFIGFKDLTLTTAAGSENFSFDRTDDGTGNTEHPFVLATIGGETKVFHAALHSESYTQYNLFMDVAGDELFIGGTFHGELPFDSSLSCGELASDVFLASLNKADGTVNSAFVSGKASQATCMAADSEAVTLSSTAATYAYDIATAETDVLDEQTYDDISANQAFVYTKDTKVYLRVVKKETALIGDVNGDNDVDIADVTTLVSMILAGLDDVVADINNDNDVDIADVTTLVSMILGTSGN